MHRVRVTGDRPDFRVFIGLLYADMHDVDTDGNSIPVYSREWTSLYMKDRESEEPYIEIERAEDERFFEIESASPRLEELAALYLCEFCGDLIEANGQRLSSDAVDSLDSEYAADLERGRASIWHQSSERVPYPNLEAEQDADDP